jgi:formate dehydrogenase major subunit
MVYPDYQPVESEQVRKRFEELWDRLLDPNPGLTVVEITDAIHTGQIHGMYIMGENPAMSDPDAGHARKGMASLEHLVVQDLFLTETAAYADVVLPASAFPEKAGTFTNTNRQVQMGRPALDLPGDARQDWWIIQEIANRLGLDWAYTGPKDVYDEMRQTMKSLNGISWDRLEREDCVTYPCDGDDQPGHEVIFGDGYPTESGRAKLVAAQVTPPDELPDDDYPLVLTTGRMLEHWHTGAMTRRATTLNMLESVAVVSIHPQQMASLGLEAGDTARVESRRGGIDIQVRADRDVPDGMVFIPFCFTEASANLLTNPQLDPYGKIPEFKFCAVRVTAATGNAEAAE